MPGRCPGFCQDPPSTWAIGAQNDEPSACSGTVTNTAANVGGVAGGAVNSSASVASTATGTTRGAVGGLNAAGQLTSSSQGVFGLEGLQLNAAAANSTQGSLITSTNRNVHLDSGTQLLFVAQGAQTVIAQRSFFGEMRRQNGSRRY